MKAVTVNNHYAGTIVLGVWAELRNRLESGMAPYALPEEWDASNVQVCSFAVQRNGRAYLDSVHLSR